MNDKGNHKNLLLNLYLINAGVNLICSLVVGVLNLLTPTEFFKLRRSYIVDDGWIYILIIYPVIIAIGTVLLYIVLRPLKKYFYSKNPKVAGAANPLRRARRRLLRLPITISLLNVSIWTGLSLLGAAILVMIKLDPPMGASPLYNYSWHSVIFASFRGIVVGCLTAGLGLLVIEAYSRKHLIPIFFPEGRLGIFKKVWKMSIRRRIRFLYYSGTVIPMIIFVGTLLYVEAEAETSTIPVTVFGRDLLFFTISLYITFVFLSLWLNLLVGRSILEPIRDMIGTIRKVRKGDLSHRARVVSNDEIGLLGDGINEMAVGLVEEEALRHSYNLAREVQTALLPASPPVIEGLDIAARSVYCEETGGDYFDFLLQSGSHESQLNVIMGDACGLGISSALLMATGRAFVRQRSAMPGTPADIVTDVNRQLVHDVEDSCQFMALFYLRFNLSQRTLTWVRAGHNPAIFCDPGTGTAEHLRGSGMVLGIDEKWRYREYHRDKLTAGQIIVLGTDGLWEAMNRKGEMFGRDPIIRILNQYADVDANGILTACLFALDNFRDGNPIEDDVSIVVIKVDRND
jgi:sigma-B regulation protein RsbU (phosphoserine phosphatase)